MVVYILGTHEKLAKRKSNVRVPSLICTHIINHFMQTEEIVRESAVTETGNGPF